MNATADRGDLLHVALFRLNDSAGREEDIAESGFQDKCVKSSRIHSVI